MEVTRGKESLWAVIGRGLNRIRIQHYGGGKVGGGQRGGGNVLVVSGGEEAGGGWGGGGGSGFGKGGGGGGGGRGWGVRCRKYTTQKKKVCATSISARSIGAATKPKVVLMTVDQT